MLKWIDALRRRRRDHQWTRRAAAVKAEGDERRELLAGQEADVFDLEALLFRHDPVGIAFKDNTDEYRPEAETITLRRHEVHSVDALRTMMHQEFVRWFDLEIAGPEARYDSIAEELWLTWGPGSQPR
ncbi:hypothetical protein [Jannaschia sp. R86511]|uniref:hypothetical protein n=1 Tax=Jannaschia sp. R86511 TaxID=3093853 RepID=UPI0036D346B5